MHMMVGVNVSSSRTALVDFVCFLPDSKERREN